MSATVPPRRSIAIEADVVNGRAVRGRTHRTVGELLNWCGGNGEVLVPGYDPGQTIAASATKVFRFRCQPPGRAVRRTWSLALYGQGTVTITAGASAAVVRDVSETGLFVQHHEDLTAKSASDQELTLTIANAASSGTITVAQIACMEAPRATLDLTTDDYGVELVSLAAREPIDSRTYNSLGGIAAALALAPQRRQYLAYARPDAAADCWTDATGVAVLALDTLPILTRKLYPASTTGSVRLYALAAASDATTDGEVVFTNNATAVAKTVTFTNPGTTFAWAYVDATDYPCELLTEDDGLRPADTFATCTVTYRRTGGAGTFWLASLDAFEIPP